MLHRSPEADVESPARAAPPEPERTGPVTISRQLFDFLMGTEGINGLHFGDYEPEKIGAFWWRRHLREADTGAAADVLVGDIEESIEPIRHWYDSVDHEPRPLVDVVTDMVFDIKADRQLLTAMRSALLAQSAAEHARTTCPECEGLTVPELCPPCIARFENAVQLRDAAMSSLDGDADRYLAMLDLSEKVSAE